MSQSVVWAASRVPLYRFWFRLQVGWSVGRLIRRRNQFQLLLVQLLMHVVRLVSPSNSGLG